MAKTEEQLKDEQRRTLYIRMPCTIKDADDIYNVIVGEGEVKLTRQSSRNCHVLFASVEDKLRNLKILQRQKIDGKKIVARPAWKKTIKQVYDKSKKPRKKVVIPRPLEEEPFPLTRELAISNINIDTKPQDIKAAFQGCTHVIMVTRQPNELTRSAVIKMENEQVAEKYLKKERDWPTVQGNEIVISPHLKKQNLKTPSRKTFSVKRNPLTVGK